MVPVVENVLFQKHALRRTVCENVYTNQSCVKICRQQSESILCWGFACNYKWHESDECGSTVWNFFLKIPFCFVFKHQLIHFRLTDVKGCAC